LAFTFSRSKGFFTLHGVSDRDSAKSGRDHNEEVTRHDHLGMIVDKSQFTPERTLNLPRT